MKFVEKVTERIKALPSFITYVWGRTPKVVKVALYIAGAAELTVLIGDIKTIDLAAIPVRYQIPLVNLAIVVLWEAVNWLKDQANNRPF